MKKPVIDIEDLLPESILRDIRNYLDMYIKGIEAVENKPIVYHIKLGNVTFELDMKMISTNVDLIKSGVLGYFNLLASEVFHKGKGSRKREVVYPRQLTVYFMDRHTILSLAQIGKKIGGYDHATVLHARKTIQNLCDVDMTVRYDVKKIGEIINKKLLGL